MSYGIINKKMIFKSVFMTMAYIHIREKVNIYWVKNDFKDIFPEVFTPWKERYIKREDDIELHDCILSLRKNPTEDIVERRKTTVNQKLIKKS